MKPLKIAWCIALAALLASPVSAAVVYLKDGTQVKGTVVSATANDVVVHTAEGTRRIPASRIERIDYAAGAAAAPAAPPPGPPGAEAAPGSEWRRLQSNGFESWRQRASIGLGLAAPVSDAQVNSADGTSASATNGTVGVLLDLEYLYFKTPRLAFGAGFDYFHRAGSDFAGPNSTNGLQFTNMSVFGNTVMFQGLARYGLTGHGRVRPYLRGGVGLHHTSTKVDAAPMSGFAWSDTNTAESRRVAEGSAWGLAASAAFGLDFGEWAPSNFGVELGWTVLTHAPQADATGAGQAVGVDAVTGSPIHVITFLGRWGWDF